jgi:uncharacterized protein YkwD
MIRLIRYWPAAILVAVFSLFAAQEKKEELKSSKVEQELIDLTNEMRKAARLTPAAPSPGPLAANPKLMTAARAHAANMAALEKLDHTLEDKTFADRAKDAGYQYRLIGENIAWSPETPKEVLEGWMNSPMHRENILKEEFTEIGVGVAKNQKGEQYWVQVFGTPLK